MGRGGVEDVKKDLPNIGGGSTLAEEATELLRLEAELPLMVESSLPARPSAPQQYPARSKHMAPSPLAVTMDQEYRMRVATACWELTAI